MKSVKDADRRKMEGLSVCNLIDIKIKLTKVQNYFENLGFFFQCFLYLVVLPM